MQDTARILDALRDNISKAFVGRRETVDLVLTARVMC